MLNLSDGLRRRKLGLLAQIEGFADVEALLAASAALGVSAGICTAERCDYTTIVEPDQTQGYCELCRGQTVASALVLAHLI